MYIVDPSVSILCIIIYMYMELDIVFKDVFVCVNTVPMQAICMCVNIDYIV